MVLKELVRLSPLSFLAAPISGVSEVTILRWATFRYPASRPWDRLCAITAHPLPRISRLNDAHRWPGVDFTALTASPYDVLKDTPSGCRDLMREVFLRHKVCPSRQPSILKWILLGEPTGSNGWVTPDMKQPGISQPSPRYARISQSPGASARRYSVSQVVSPAALSLSLVGSQIYRATPSHDERAVSPLCLAKW